MKHILCYVALSIISIFFCEQIMAREDVGRQRVIVIDAGHGGKAYPGAVYGGVKEKDINLAVALKLGALIEKELPNAKVVYTRKTDTALGQSLNEDLSARANIANKAEGDLFISIHANAAKNTSVKGAETLIMGESEKETRYNEDALYDNRKDELIDMSDENTAAMVRAYIQNLQFTYGEYSEMMARIMQSHYGKGGRTVRKVKRQLLKVLYATDMPSVLTELGFMTNKSELAYMKSEKGQNELARMLCNAVKEYFAHLDGTASAMVSDNVVEEVPTAMEKENLVAENVSVAEPAKQEVVADKAEAVEASVEGYAIQLLASDKKLKTSDAQFKTYRGKVKCYEGSGVLKYKYCYGEFATRAEAQQNVAVVRKVFKDAFVIHFSDGKIVK
jgi:N-acetylmuramoyl-L-alanine amidase